MSCTPDQKLEFKRGEDAEYLMSVARRAVFHVVKPRLPADKPQGASKEDEKCWRSIEERWLAGYRDTVHALRHPEVLVEDRPDFVAVHESRSWPLTTHRTLVANCRFRGSRICC